MLYFSLTLLLPPATIHLLFLYCSPAFAHAACASLHRGFQLLIHKPLLHGFLLPLVSSPLFPSPQDMDQNIFFLTPGLRKVYASVLLSNFRHQQKGLCRLLSFSSCTYKHLDLSLAMKSLKNGSRIGNAHVRWQPGLCKEMESTKHSCSTVIYETLLQVGKRKWSNYLDLIPKLQVSSFECAIQTAWPALQNKMVVKGVCALDKRS